MTEFAQQLINGLVTGFGFILASLGLNVVFGTLRIVNFAHGALYVVGGYLCYTLSASAGLAYWLAAPVAALSVGAGCAALDPLVFRRIRGRGEIAGIVVTFGIALAVQQGVQLVWGPDLLALPAPLTSSTTATGSLFLNNQLALSVGVAVLCTAALVLILRRTWLGLQVRVLAADPATAELMGVRVGRISAATWAIGGGLAALSGALLLPVSGLQPDLGFPLAITAFTVVIIGTVGSIAGMTVASLGLGVVLALVEGYLATGINDIVMFSLLLLVLLVRPDGLFRSPAMAR